MALRAHTFQGPKLKRIKISFRPAREKSPAPLKHIWSQTSDVNFLIMNLAFGFCSAAPRKLLSSMPSIPAVAGYYTSSTHRLTHALALYSYCSECTELGLIVARLQRLRLDGSEDPSEDSEFGLP